MTVLDHILKIVSYSHLIIILVAFIFNSFAFMVFRFSQEFRHNSSMVYLSFIVILDFLVLFTYNLDRYLLLNFGFQMEEINLLSCRVISFLLFFICMSLGFLYSFISVDRLITIYSTPGSILKKLPFSTAKSACYWAIGLIGAAFIINLPILFLNGYYIIDYSNSNQSNSTKLICNEHSYMASTHLFSLYSNLNMVLYSIVPFVSTSICNTLIIKLILTKSKKSSRKNLGPHENEKIKKKQQMTVSLIIITFVFLFMTLPLLSYYAFSHLIDRLPYTNAIEEFLAILHVMNHASVFFTSWCTYPKFRVIFKRFFKQTKKKETFVVSKVL